MNPVTNALFAGYTAMQIIEFVMRQFPRSRGRIEHALQAGYSPDQIASHFQKQFEGKANTKKKQQISDLVGKGMPTDAQKSHARELRGKREQGLLNTLGTAAALGGTALAARSLGAFGGDPAGGMQAAASQLPFYGQGPGATGMPLPGATPQTGMAAAGGGLGGLPMADILKNYVSHVAGGGRVSLNSFMRSMMGTMAKGATQPTTPMAAGSQSPIDVTNETQVTTPSQPQQPAPQQQAEVNPASKAALQPEAVPQDAATSQLPKPTNSVEEAKAIIDNLGIEPTIRVLAKAGNTPEAIAAGVQFKLPKETQRMLKQSGIDLPSVIGTYLSQNPTEQQAVQQPPLNQAQPMPPMQGAQQLPQVRQKEQPLSGDSISQIAKKMQIGYADAAKVFDQMQAQQPPVQQPQMQEPSKAALQPEVSGEFPETLESSPIGKAALLPDGRIGTVTGLENGRVGIDSDGKSLKVPEAHVLTPTDETIPQSMQQLARSYADMIPESEKSAPIWFNHYNPSSRTAFVGFFSDPDSLGVYSDVSPEDWAAFNSGKNIAVSSGETGFGAEYTAGEPSKFGAGLRFLKYPGGDKKNGERQYEKQPHYSYVKEFIKETGKLPKPGQIAKGEAKATTDALISPPKPKTAEKPKVTSTLQEKPSKPKTASEALGIKPEPVKEEPKAKDKPKPKTAKKPKPSPKETREEKDGSLSRHDREKAEIQDKIWKREITEAKVKLGSIFHSLKTEKLRKSEREELSRTVDYLRMKIEHLEKLRSGEWERELKVAGERPYDKLQNDIDDKEKHATRLQSLVQEHPKSSSFRNDLERVRGEIEGLKKKKEEKEENIPRKGLLALNDSDMEDLQKITDEIAAIPKKGRTGEQNFRLRYLQHQVEQYKEKLEDRTGNPSLLSIIKKGSISDKMPKPKKGEVVYVAPDGIRKTQGDTYDNLWLVSRSEGTKNYRITHMPTGFGIGTFRKKGTTLELIKWIYEQDLYADVLFSREPRKVGEYLSDKIRDKIRELSKSE